MEQYEKHFVMSHDHIASEMEPVVERLNGLEELLMIVTNEPLREKIAKEKAILEQQYSEWLNKTGAESSRHEIL
jgi:hypothetical protein